MRNLVGAYVATLVVMLGLVACARFGPRDISLANEICNNNNKRSPSRRIVTVAELRGLVEEMNNNLFYVDCDARIKLAINELNDLIRVKHVKDVCSQASADDIAEYYRKHLAARNETTTTSNRFFELPETLKKLFISYGLKVSSLCRRQMVNRLMVDAEKLIDEADMKEVADLTGQRKYIATFMGDPSETRNHGHLALPDSFVQMMKLFDSFNTSSEEKLLLQLSTTERVHRIQTVCKRRFKPIYSDLILPLVSLGEVGFNLNTEDVKPELNVIKQVYEWYRIVFLCEAIMKVEFFQATEDQLKGSQSDRRLVQILAKEEANKLREDGQFAMIVDSSDSGVNTHQIHYKPGLAPISFDGAIYNSNDLKLEKAIETLSRQIRHQNDPDMGGRMAGFINDRINRVVIKILAKVTGLKNLPADGQLTGVHLVKLLDEYLHGLETGDSKAVSFMAMGRSQGLVYFDWNNRSLVISTVVAVVLIIIFFCTPVG